MNLPSAAFLFLLQETFQRGAELDLMHSSAALQLKRKKRPVILDRHITGFGLVLFPVGQMLVELRNLLAPAVSRPFRLNCQAKNP
jgi:hypothetical protein